MLKREWDRDRVETYRSGGNCSAVTENLTAPIQFIEIATRPSVALSDSAIGWMVVSSDVWPCPRPHASELVAHF